MMSIKCPKCQTDNTEDSQFCKKNVVLHLNMVFPIPKPLKHQPRKSKRPTRQAAGHVQRSLRSSCAGPCSKSLCETMYFWITSLVIRSPTVRAKYPSSHISPDHNLFFNPGNSRNNILALLLFIILTTSPMDSDGGNDTII
jgi:hypothetical protein